MKPCALHVRAPYAVICTDCGGGVKALDGAMMAIRDSLASLLHQGASGGGICFSMKDFQTETNTLDSCAARTVPS
jgi:hypothetical protein